VFVDVEDAQKHDGGAGSGLLERAERLKAVEAGHVDV